MLQCERVSDEHMHMCRSHKYAHACKGAWTIVTGDEMMCNALRQVLVADVARAAVEAGHPCVVMPSAHVAALLSMLSQCRAAVALGFRGGNPTLV